MKKILIMGLPRAGKTTLALALKDLLNAVHFNADAVRAEINKDLGFSVEDRVEQARRMGWLCDQVVAAGHYAVADFVCPTRETREAFGSAYTIYVDTSAPTPYADTKALFEPPAHYDYRVTTQDGVRHAVDIATILQSDQFNWKAPTALFLGRYQPFHDGHKALIIEGIERVGQAVIAVRDTKGTSPKDPFGYAFVMLKIQEAMKDYLSKITIIKVPNITNIFYGRDVGYQIERIDLPDALQAISATKIRAEMEKSS